MNTKHGDWHNAAQRHLLNRFLGQLHHCFQTRQYFDEQPAFAPLLQVALPRSSQAAAGEGRWKSRAHSSRWAAVKAVARRAVQERQVRAYHGEHATRLGLYLICGAAPAVGGAIVTYSGIWLHTR